MRTLFLTFVALVIIAPKTNAQSYQGQRNQILAYNILSNGLISGIGGAINKKKGEKIFPVFFKNFSKGCLGGLIKYSGKSQTFYLKNQNNTYLAPFNRALFFLGHSISMNASMNQRTLENYYCNFYGIDFKYSPYQSSGNKFSAKMSLGTVLSVVNFAYQGHKFNFYNSLEYGQFYFDIDSSYTYKGVTYNGFGSYNAFAIRQLGRRGVANNAIPHEVVHTFQNYDFFALSSLYKKRLDNALNKFKPYNKLSKYINFDYEPLFFRVLYKLQKEPTYYRNHFEFEAEHFSDRRFIKRF